jgi:hypothetical protein
MQELDFSVDDWEVVYMYFKQLNNTSDEEQQLAEEV